MTAAAHPAPTTERIGIIGLGRMGAAMAQRMAAQGCRVTGWTRSGRPVEGVTCAGDLAALVAGCDTLILSLFDDEAVAETLDRLLTMPLHGRQIVETSTVVPDVLKDRIARIEAQGATAVDAPISGGPDLVLAGRCGVFVGGSAAAAARAGDVLAAISDRILHVGPLGAGLVMKTINNAMIEAYLTGLHDLMPLAHRAGLSLETVLTIVSGGPIGAPFLTSRLPKILGADDTVGFTLRAALKDKDVFDRIARSHGVAAPTIARFGEVVGGAIDEGLGDCDPAMLVTRAYARGAPG